MNIGNIDKVNIEKMYDMMKYENDDGRDGVLATSAVQLAQNRSHQVHQVWFNFTLKLNLCS